MNIARCKGCGRESPDMRDVVEFVRHCDLCGRSEKTVALCAQLDIQLHGNGNDRILDVCVDCVTKPLREAIDKLKKGPA